MSRSMCVLWLLALAACSGEPARSAADAPPPEEPPCGLREDIEYVANTTDKAVRTGGTTALEGIKTFGRSAGGLVEGGTPEAKKRWRKGAKRTKETAREGGRNTREAARAKPCQD